MMNMTKIDLSKLSPELRKSLSHSITLENTLKSEDPLIDGTILTENSNIKYRRKRIVSEVKPYKRTEKVQEFLNYCKFKIGELPNCSKPSKMTFKVLADYKNHRLDNIPKAYMEIIHLNKELVEKAAHTDLRLNNRGCLGKKSKTKALHTFEIDGIQFTTKAKIDQSLKCAKAFIQWLNIQALSSPQVIKDPIKYITQIRLYIKDKNAPLLMSIIKQVLDKKPWILENYHPEKSGKQYILAKNNVNSNYVEVTENMKAIELPKEPKVILEKINPVVTSAIPEVSTSTVSKMTANDALSTLIILAKKAGASEIIIKL